MRGAVLLATCLVACSGGRAGPDAGPDAAIDAGAAAPDASVDAGTCAGRDQARCESGACGVVQGWHSADAGVDYRALPRVFAGCRELDSSGGLSCQPAFGCAIPEAGSADCWLFSDQCFPAGWVRVSCTAELCPRL